MKSEKHNAKSVPRFLPKHKHKKVPLQWCGSHNKFLSNAATPSFSSKIIIVRGATLSLSFILRLFFVAPTVDGKMKGINRQILLLSSNI